MVDITSLTMSAIEYDKGDPKRIQHFIKVHSLARLIGVGEGLEGERLGVLEAAAVLHDIGIHNCEKKYGSCSGKYQETEGVPVAKELLSQLGAEDSFTEQVCFLIAHHHTYEGVDRIEWQILLEADFLVNAYEDGLSAEAVRIAGKKLFATETGKRLLSEMYEKRADAL